jgi:hypothetical protein
MHIAKIGLFAIRLREFQGKGLVIECSVSWMELWALSEPETLS